MSNINYPNFEYLITDYRKEGEYMFELAYLKMLIILKTYLVMLLKNEIFNELKFKKKILIYIS